MTKTIRILFLFLLILLILPVGLTRVMVEYYEHKYSNPIQEGRMPDEVVKTSGGTEEEKPEYSAKIMNNSVVLIRNGNIVWKSQSFEYLNWYSHVDVLIHNNTIYVAILKEKGIVGIKEFYQDIDVVYHLQERYLLALDLNGNLKWYYKELKGCKPGEGCYPSEIELKLKNSRLYVTYAPFEKRTLVFNVD
ncbi:hypothetical protein ADU37_CDS14150 [Thermococcus sp. 2319x1]|uniref:hypothetical protein n=1 Tax=Thermococcus sp. 2319x1 TaxID=1674923 RepID=UPI00073AD7FE|nr:hypothetical protein [Thermococcus sp. 2319x1]ALV63114.1 hypothetical protein ADU37_CDS14150 [Thermococcus sp. 2319x1]